MTNDNALKARAERVIPGGMYGHMSVYRRMPPAYPQYFDRASGCRLWDVDGNEYIDFMCSYGPMIAGYGNPRIRAAADAQRARLDIANAPPAVIVDLAEQLTNQVSHASWAIFAKNGNDATTVCNMVARAYSEKPNILVASGAYHGAQPWANRTAKGAPEADHLHYPTYDYNDVDSLATAASAVSGDLAGIVVSAFKHDAGKHQELVDPAFALKVREICDEEGATLILDDVRAGLRLSLDSSWSALGVQPDLSAWGKAIANGEPLAAILGSETYREAAASIFVTGSFWYQGAPLAAAAETLNVLTEADAPRRLERLGQQFRDGLYEQAQRHGHAIRQSGPPQMPTVMFEEDPKLEKGFAFCAAGLGNGVYLHPWHNMFLSIAHTERDIEEALEATDKSFAAL
ncbi:MAG: aminotransferase class III-fold pyridoxal phosphate-dependent enzyme [Pseudomonadales bacterium]|jgi:glutamate-1-semialdehyde 2,1-aminomutase|nr:aminotransferase class III-fold pyridoxal phosphate-dependent enzyme [Pseudomonadales bacterium]MDP6829307.1 aminotransferase class III-fold pyridoxal phosphate-dependent enzyme [Pseudomonadales bacterium]